MKVKAGLNPSSRHSETCTNYKKNFFLVGHHTRKQVRVTTRIYFSSWWKATLKERQARSFYARRAKKRYVQRFQFCRVFTKEAQMKVSFFNLISLDYSALVFYLSLLSICLQKYVSNLQKRILEFQQHFLPSFKSCLLHVNGQSWKRDVRDQVH